MAIQSTQVPMYTNTHCFLYFSIFIFIFMKNKINQNWKEKKKNKNKLNKTMHKTSPTQNNKVKHTSNAIKNREGERAVT